MKLALYDMDRTITDQPSWMAWLLFWARREAPWRLLLLPGLVPLLACYPLFGRRGLKQAMHWLLMGRRVPGARVRLRAAEFAQGFGARAERADALARMAEEKAQGWTIVIATASCGFYAGALAARWGADALVATANRWEGDWLTHRIAGDNCYGEAKARMVGDWLAGREVEAMRFYSDHVSDAPLFAAASEPVAVSPSAALARLAHARGWKIVSWS
ncbi:MAG: HAD-IB family phosphatase [Sphingomonadaceae bacterium]